MSRQGIDLHALSGFPGFHAGLSMPRLGGFVPSGTTGLSPVTAATATTASFDLERDIPAIMIAKGWTHGAAFQKKWFTGPAKIMNPKLRLHDTSLPVDDTSITMAWIRSFARADKVCKDIVSSRIWLTENAKKQWKLRLDDEFAKPQNRPNVRIYFGNLKLTGRAAYEQHLTYAPMDQIMEPGGKPDDLLAAMGRFAFYVLPQGTAEVDAARKAFNVKLENIGLMVGDYFDFDGFQPLGWWALPDKMEMPSYAEMGLAEIHRNWVLGKRPGYTWVDNQTYRDWRTANGRGQDILVFSDVQVIAINETFVIPWS